MHKRRVAWSLCPCLRAPASARLNCLSTVWTVWMCFATCFDARAWLCSLRPHTHGQLCLKCRSNKRHELRCLLRPEEWRRSAWNMSTNNKRSSKWIRPLSSSWNCRNGKKNVACSFHPWTTVWLVPLVLADARSGWLMVWKDNIIGFWKHLSPEEWLYVLLCDICDTKRGSCCKTTDIWDEENNTHCVEDSNQGCGR